MPANKHDEGNSVAAPAVSGLQDVIHLGLRLPKASISGSISASVSEAFLTESLVTIDLSGLKIYLETDFSTSAGVSESVELFASEQLAISVCYEPGWHGRKSVANRTYN